MTFLNLIYLLLWASFVSASPIFKRDFPSPLTITGDVKGHVHDPSVIRRDDGTYFLFTTNDGINIATASAMSGPWTHQGSVLPKGSKIKGPGRTDIWCPDVFQHGDLFYLYYAVSALGSGSSDIGVATSSTMEAGSWTDHGSLGLPQSDRYNLIDPNLFRQNDQSPFYLTFGSFWGDIFQVRLNDPPLNAVDSTQISQLEYNSTNPANEGSYQFWWNVDGTDYFYLFFSAGNCCNKAKNLASPGNEYKVMVCRSLSPFGGFVNQDGNDCLSSNGGTLVLGSHDDVYAPGGGGVFFDTGATNSILLYYHYVKPSVGYGYQDFFFGYNRLDFSSGWPVVVE